MASGKENADQEYSEYSEDHQGHGNGSGVENA